MTVYWYVLLTVSIRSINFTERTTFVIFCSLFLETRQTETKREYNRELKNLFKKILLQTRNRVILRMENLIVKRKTHF